MAQISKTVVRAVKHAKNTTQTAVRMKHPKNIQEIKPHCASPPAQLVWRGYDWLAPVCEPVHVFKQDAAEQMALLNGRDTGTSCVWLSLLAFHRAGDPSTFFKRQWNDVEVGELDRVLTHYTRAINAAVELYTIVEGAIRLEKKIGGNRKRRARLLIVPGGEEVLHCLPLHKPLYNVRVERCLPPVVDKEEPKPAEVAAVDVASSSNAVVATVGSVATPDVSNVHEGELWVEVPFFSSVTDNRLVANAHGPVSYCGIQAPPEPMFWWAGWFASQAPDVTLMGAVLSAMWWPDCASATIDMFVEYGCQPLYVDVRFENGLQAVDRRIVTDGTSSVQFFTDGDVIVRGDDSWIVKRAVPGYLRVQKCRVGLYGCTRAGRAGARVAPPASRLDKTTLRKAEWAAVVLSSERPLDTAILTRMRADEAASGWTGVDPQSAKDIVSVLTSRYGPVHSVAGPYGWGYCYSCGAPASGKLDQRICKGCTGHNTTLGRMVAVGCKVTSQKSPVAYPGVVWTRSKHPPLKSGVETVATMGNFPMPHRA